MKAPPPIEGIVESILYVGDLSRAIGFYQDVLGLEPMFGDPARFQSFRAGVHQVLLLFKRCGTMAATTVPGGVIPPHDGHGPHHIGFAVTPAALEEWLRVLPAAGVPIESTASWPHGGRSIFFRDPDGHLLEFVTPGIWPNY